MKDNKPPPFLLTSIDNHEQTRWRHQFTAIYSYAVSVIWHWLVLFPLMRLVYGAEMSLLLLVMNQLLSPLAVISSCLNFFSFNFSISAVTVSEEQPLEVFTCNNALACVSACVVAFKWPFQNVEVAFRRTYIELKIIIEIKFQWKTKDFLHFKCFIENFFNYWSINNISAQSPSTLKILTLTSLPLTFSKNCSLVLMWTCSGMLASRPK